MKNRQIKIEPFKMVCDSFSKGFDRGFVIKREVNIKEARYILKTLLGIEIYDRDDCEDNEEYKYYNEDLVNDVNDWLKGNTDDSTITDYASECADEPLGIWNAFKIAQYLSKKGVI